MMNVRAAQHEHERQQDSAAFVAEPDLGFVDAFRSGNEGRPAIFRPLEQRDMLETQADLAAHPAERGRKDRVGVERSRLVDDRPVAAAYHHDRSAAVVRVPRIELELAQPSQAARHERRQRARVVGQPIEELAPARNGILGHPGENLVQQRKLRAAGFPIAAIEQAFGEEHRPCLGRVAVQLAADPRDVLQQGRGLLRCLIEAPPEPRQRVFQDVFDTGKRRCGTIAADAGQFQCRAAQIGCAIGGQALFELFLIDPGDAIVRIADIQEFEDFRRRALGLLLRREP